MSLRLVLNLSDEVELAVLDLARLREVSAAEVIRQALTTEKYLDDAMRAGKTILIQDRDKTHVLIFKGLEDLPPMRIKRRWRRK